jgi:hypothetical protein
MSENWLPVVGFEELYEISDYGNLKTIKTGKLKKPTRNKKDGRMYALLWKKNQYKLIKIHRLVLTAFVGPCPDGMECCHNDGDASNNLLQNLRWDTPQNNQLDRIKHGTSNRGERCASSKLTETQVRSILQDTRPQKQIAQEYGVRQSQISRIKNRTRWTHIQLP